MGRHSSGTRAAESKETSVETDRGIAAGAGNAKEAEAGREEEAKAGIEREAEAENEGGAEPGIGEGHEAGSEAQSS